MSSDTNVKKRICKRCGIEKPDTEFKIKKDNKVPRSCKQCKTEYMKNYMTQYLKNEEKRVRVNEQQRERKLLKEKVKLYNIQSTSEEWKIQEE